MLVSYNTTWCHNTGDDLKHHYHGSLKIHIRIVWYGHVSHMEYKWILSFKDKLKMPSKWPWGRPRTRWRDDM